MSAVGAAVVVGATGQTGSAMVRELLSGDANSVTRVVAYGNSRKPTYSGHRAEIFTAMQAPMEALAGPRSNELRGFDSLFIHVGTQRRKAGLEGQILLEYDHSLAVAQAAKNGGCKTCHLVSSMGADKNASIQYLQTKGRIEQALQDLGFERLCIYRPGALYGGDRSQSVFHSAILPMIMVMSFGIITRIHVDKVAKAMRIVASRQPTGAVEIYENAELLKLSK